MIKVTLIILISFSVWFGLKYILNAMKRIVLYILDIPQEKKEQCYICTCGCMFDKSEGFDKIYESWEEEVKGMNFIERQKIEQPFIVIPFGKCNKCKNKEL